MTTTILFDNDSSSDSEVTSKVNSSISSMIESAFPETDINKEIEESIKNDDSSSKSIDLSTVNNSEPVSIEDIQNFGIVSYIEDNFLKNVNSQKRGRNVFLAIKLVKRLIPILQGVAELFTRCSNRDISVDIQDKYFKQGSLFGNTFTDKLAATIIAAQETVRKMEADPAYRNYNRAIDESQGVYTTNDAIFEKELKDMFTDIINQENEERKKVKESLKSKGMGTDDIKDISGGTPSSSTSSDGGSGDETLFYPANYDDMSETDKRNARTKWIERQRLPKDLDNFFAHLIKEYENSGNTLKTEDKVGILTSLHNYTDKMRNAK